MILNGVENRKYAGLILIEFQKAFDTSEFKVLRDELNGFILTSQAELFSFHQPRYFRKQSS